jgi:hypothetical protein
VYVFGIKSAGSLQPENMATNFAKFNPEIKGCWWIEAFSGGQPLSP